MVGSTKRQQAASGALVIGSGVGGVAASSGQGAGDTIRPPLNPSEEERCERLLASQFDALKVSVYVNWKDVGFLKRLGIAKRLARERDGEQLLEIEGFDEDESSTFLVKPFGSNGNEFIVYNGEYSFVIANRKEAMEFRPNVIATVRSDALWSLGAEECCRRLWHSIELNGGEVSAAKVSRTDLCVDLLLPKSIWNRDLVLQKVTRATDVAIYQRWDRMEGMKIGKGDLQARIYDKQLEIAQKSKKYWLYKAWGIDECPEGFEIIRVEFQLRREALKKLGIDKPSDLWAHKKSLWSYCTTKWLEMRLLPERRVDHRPLAEWWRTVQSGFAVERDVRPLIRGLATSAEESRLVHQGLGFLVTASAVGPIGDLLSRRGFVTIDEFEEYLIDLVRNWDLDDFMFSDLVKRKLAKMAARNEKAREAEQLRLELGSGFG